MKSLDQFVYVIIVLESSFSSSLYMYVRCVIYRIAGISDINFRRKTVFVTAHAYSDVMHN